ncbi:cytochrome c5 family protein [Bacterioplanes sanyensis]|uniref:Cytochrome c5 family protein n=1 Tax=Bacterioplanes sanyensis TaxID=1249553 RepID=A0A222FPZ2_9GAMM|nr:cytochrome c5 family protein [Bacterioplanes sanyensis]
MKKLTVIAAMAAAALSANVQAFDVDAKYKQACAACHAMAVAGAPKSFDKAAWEPRLALGMDTLVASVTNGKGAMPPRGLCMDCTPDQYKQLINYMAAPRNNRRIHLQPGSDDEKPVD